MQFIFHLNPSFLLPYTELDVWPAELWLCTGFPVLGYGKATCKLLFGKTTGIIPE